MKTYNNKILILILVILAAVYGLSRVFRSSKLESNLRNNLLPLEVKKISKIEIITVGDTSIMALVRSTQGTWKVVYQDKEADADEGGVVNALEAMVDMKIQRMTSRKETQWKNFQVDDSSAIKVMVYDKEKRIGDFRIGKIGYSKHIRGDVFTYVRVAGETETYTTSGIMSSHFDKKYDAWRDKVVLKLTEEDREGITELSFNYADSSFLLQKKDSLWYVGDNVVDNNAIDTYLKRLRIQYATGFDDLFVPTNDAPLSLDISSVDDLLVQLQLWFKNDTEWVLSSTLRQGIYFSGEKNDPVVKDIFVGERFFYDNTSP